MAVRDLVHNLFVTPTVHPSSRVNGTSNGVAVDLRGFDSAVIMVAFGSWTDGTHTPSIQHSVDGVTYNTCAASDLDGTLTAVNSSAGANKAQQIGYIGNRRYIRAVMTVTGATTGAVSQAAVITGTARMQPTN